MKLRKKLTALAIFGAIATATPTVGAQFGDGINTAGSSDGKAYEMGCGLRPALTESGWFPAGTGWVNATVDRCDVQRLRLDYWSADGNWYPAFLGFQYNVDNCIPELIQTGAPGRSAILRFRSWRNNVGCELTTDWIGTRFKVNTPLSSHEEGVVWYHHAQHVYALGINYHDGLNGSETYFEVSFGN